MKNLINPTPKYINRIENSCHYLNDPKHMYNYDLDTIYRLSINISKDYVIQNITDFLKFYGTPKPKETAIKFVEWRDNISMRDFERINVNTYIKKTPLNIKAKHKKICEWIESHTKYCNGIEYKSDYPFLYK